MNLSLHLGLLGALEAGLIALLAGVIVYALWSRVCRRAGLSIGHAIGWSCLIAVVIGAGVDAWNLFYLGMMKLESPLYARLALQGIHDPQSLGARVLLEMVGALAGVVIGWRWFSQKPQRENLRQHAEKTNAES